MCIEHISYWYVSTVQPVPAWVEEPVNPVKQSSSGGATTLSQDAFSQHGKGSCQNWHTNASAQSATGGEHETRMPTWLLFLFYTSALFFRYFSA